MAREKISSKNYMLDEEGGERESESAGGRVKERKRVREQEGEGKRGRE